MKYAYWTIVILLLSIGCKKDENPTNGINTFHKNIIIHEKVRVTALKQQALGLFQLQDAKKILFTASRGLGEAEGKGFRIGTITKDLGCDWIRSYYLSDSYPYQFANCSVFDKKQYTWVAGNLAGVPNDYIRPFIVKLNTNGDILWSKYLVYSNLLTGGRSTALLVLKNGDLAYLTNSWNELTLYRMSVDGTILWGKTITHNFTTTSLGYTNHHGSQRMTEGPDGSIYMAIGSNAASDSKNVLIKVSSTGNLIFAKSYSYWPSAKFIQPHIVCLNDGRIIYADTKNVEKFCPYFFVLAADGSLQAAMGMPENSPQSIPLYINEIQCHNNILYLTTCRQNQVNMYKFDASLNVLSSVKILNTSYQLYEGGLSLFDSDSSRWYHMWNFTGGENTGNGFQYMKTKEEGASCHLNFGGPEKLLLQSIPVITQNEAGVTIKNATLPSLHNLSWVTAPVTISAEENVCGN